MLHHSVSWKYSSDVIHVVLCVGGACLKHIAQKGIYFTLRSLEILISLPAQCCFGVGRVVKVCDSRLFDIPSKAYSDLMLRNWNATTHIREGATYCEGCNSKSAKRSYNFNVSRLFNL